MCHINLVFNNLIFFFLCRVNTVCERQETLRAGICQDLPRETFSSGRVLVFWAFTLLDVSESFPTAFVVCWAGISLHMAFPFKGKAHFY